MRGAAALAAGSMLALAACATSQPAQLLAGPRSGSGRPPPQARRLRTELAALARAFPGRAGIAVEDVSAGWRVGYDGWSLYPQQSVSKLCTAVATLAAVDAGRDRLDAPVRVTRADMSVFHQPIQARLDAAGRWDTNVGELLTYAVAESDNAADDILIRRAGGPDAVQGAVDARGVHGVRCGPEERVLQSRIAGLDWRPEYSFGQAFWTARDRLPPAFRRAKLDAYLADPPDGAEPLALADMLARLDRGELLSVGSTAWLLGAMTATRTGPERLKAGLGSGWAIAHKTGTGQDLGERSTGNDDVGVVTAPDGRAYAVVVMIADTRAPVPERQRLDAAVARAVVRAHDDTPP